MAAVDRTQQIGPLAGGAAPFSYTVPPSFAFTLLGVYAVFDGTAAAGAFLPCVEIVSDSGKIMARVKGQSVAAGSSAEPTFAPFLDDDSGSGSTNPLAILFNTDPQANSFVTVEATQAGTAFTLKATGGGSFNISATGSAAFSTVNLAADAQIFESSPALTKRIGAGGDLIVQDHSGVTILDIWEARTVEWFLGNGRRFSLFDHSGNEIFRVDEGGGVPTYHIKTGGAWVADL